MNIIRALLFMACVVPCILAGCAKKQQFETVEQICIEEKRPAIGDTEKSITTIMRVAEDVLGRLHFSVEKADAELGYIRTRPLAGAQFFEFWRRDNVGAFNSAEANLHTIRRIVELNISQQGEQLCIDCDVRTQRLSLAERKTGSGTHAYGMFSASKLSMQKLELDSKQKAWVDLGEDDRLATVILKRIEERLDTDFSHRGHREHGEI